MFPPLGGPGRRFTECRGRGAVTARDRLAVVGAVALALVVGVVPLGRVPAPAPAAGEIYNLDGHFTDAHNDLVWDPNFLPGFGVAPGVHINWSAPTGGPGVLDYYVGPWANGNVAAYPHFAVGPQAFNFVEVPRTQVFRSPAWGDFERVDQGFRACAVNLGNVTVNASAALHPVYVGMPVAGTDWTVRFPLLWSAPTYPTADPVGAELTLVATLALPPLPGTLGARLVYVNLVLWSSAPAPLGVGAAPGAPTEGDVGSGTFAYDQLPPTGANRTYAVDLSSYLGATLTGLGLPVADALLSYVYLNAGGYNAHLHLAIPWLELWGPSGLCADAP